MLFLYLLLIIYKFKLKLSLTIITCSAILLTLTNLLLNLRSYSQIDPLVAYKRETYDLYQRTLSNIRNTALKNLLSSSPQMGGFSDNFDISHFLSGDMIKAIESRANEVDDEKTISITLLRISIRHRERLHSICRYSE